MRDSAGTMTYSLTWICHASTAAARTAAFPGDEPIDAIGERDCGKASPPGGADRVWVAPERRTTRTAELLGLSASVDAALRDADHGRWAGFALEDVVAKEPEGLRAWMEDSNAAPHGGESMQTLFDRVADWMERRRVAGGREIAVTHPNLVRMAIAHALGAGPDAARHIDVAPLGMAVTAWNGRWRLRALGPLIA
jgi:broad specificity phosphatase PhoE